MEEDGLDVCAAVLVIVGDVESDENFDLVRVAVTLEVDDMVADAVGCALTDPLVVIEYDELGDADAADVADAVAVKVSVTVVVTDSVVVDVLVCVPLIEGIAVAVVVAVAEWLLVCDSVDE